MKTNYLNYLISAFIDFIKPSRLAFMSPRKSKAASQSPTGDEASGEQVSPLDPHLGIDTSEAGAKLDNEKTRIGGEMATQQHIINNAKARLTAKNELEKLEAEKKKRAGHDTFVQEKEYQRRKKDLESQMAGSDVAEQTITEAEKRIASLEQELAELDTLTATAGDKEKAPRRPKGTKGKPGKEHYDAIEKAFTENEAAIKTLLEAIVKEGYSGQWKEWNDKFCEILGVTEGDVNEKGKYVKALQDFIDAGEDGQFGKNTLASLAKKLSTETPAEAPAETPEDRIAFLNKRVDYSKVGYANLDKLNNPDITPEDRLAILEQALKDQTTAVAGDKEEEVAEKTPEEIEAEEKAAQEQAAQEAEEKEAAEKYLRVVNQAFKEYKLAGREAMSANDFRHYFDAAGGIEEYEKIQGDVGASRAFAEKIETALKSFDAGNPNDIAASAIAKEIISRKTAERTPEDEAKADALADKLARAMEARNEPQEQAVAGDKQTAPSTTATPAPDATTEADNEAEMAAIKEAEAQFSGKTQFTEAEDPEPSDTPDPEVEAAKIAATLEAKTSVSPEEEAALSEMEEALEAQTEATAEPASEATTEAVAGDKQTAEEAAVEEEPKEATELPPTEATEATTEAVKNVSEGEVEVEDGVMDFTKPAPDAPSEPAKPAV